MDRNGALWRFWSKGEFTGIMESLNCRIGDLVFLNDTLYIFLYKTEVSNKSIGDIQYGRLHERVLRLSVQAGETR